MSSFDAPSRLNTRSSHKTNQKTGKKALGVAHAQHCRDLLKCKGIPKAAKLILGTILAHADFETGIAYPSQAEIAEMTANSIKHVRRIIHRLEDVHAITIIATNKADAVVLGYTPQLKISTDSHGNIVPETMNTYRVNLAWDGLLKRAITEFDKQVLDGHLVLLSRRPMDSTSKSPQQGNQNHILNRRPTDTEDRIPTDTEDRIPTDTEDRIPTDTEDPRTLSFQRYHFNGEKESLKASLSLLEGREVERPKGSKLQDQDPDTVCKNKSDPSPEPPYTDNSPTSISHNAEPTGPEEAEMEIIDYDQFLRFIQLFHIYNPDRPLVADNHRPHIQPVISDALIRYWNEDFGFRTKYRDVIYNLRCSKGALKKFIGPGKLNPTHLFKRKRLDDEVTMTVWQLILIRHHYRPYNKTPLNLQPIAPSDPSPAILLDPTEPEAEYVPSLMTPENSAQYTDDEFQAMAEYNRALREYNDQQPIHYPALFRSK